MVTVLGHSAIRSHDLEIVHPDHRAERAISVAGCDGGADVTQRGRGRCGQPRCRVNDYAKREADFIKGVAHTGQVGNSFKKARAARFRAYWRYASVRSFRFAGSN